MGVFEKLKEHYVAAKQKKMNAAIEMNANDFWCIYLTCYFGVRLREYGTEKLTELKHNYVKEMVQMEFAMTMESIISKQYNVDIAKMIFKSGLPFCAAGLTTMGLKFAEILPNSTLVNAFSTALCTMGAAMALYGIKNAKYAVYPSGVQSDMYMEMQNEKIKDQYYDAATASFDEAFELNSLDQAAPTLTKK